MLSTVAPLKIRAPAWCARTSKLTSKEFFAPKLQPVAQSPQPTHFLRLTLPELVESFIATVIAAARNVRSEASARIDLYFCGRPSAWSSIVLRAPSTLAPNSESARSKYDSQVGNSCRGR